MKVKTLVPLVSLLAGCSYIASPQPYDTDMDLRRNAQLQYSASSSETTDTVIQGGAFLPPANESVTGEVTGQQPFVGGTSSDSGQVTSVPAGQGLKAVLSAHCRQNGIIGGAGVEECARSLAALDRVESEKAIAAKCASSIEALKTEACKAYVLSLHPKAVVVVPGGRSGYHTVPRRRVGLCETMGQPCGY